MPQTTSSAQLTELASQGRGTFSLVTEIVANLATIVAAVLISAVLVKAFLLPRAPSPGPQPPVQQSFKGTSVRGSLPGVNWANNGRTLVLALSTQCHFCAESLPFYQRITKDRASNLKLLAVLPQSKADAEQFLSKGGVRVDDVRQVTLDSIGVRGTPTLLLIDANGTVIDEWQGKLAPDQEDHALSELRKSS